jgi:hypothetical protein
MLDETSPAAPMVAAAVNDAGDGQRSAAARGRASNGAAGRHHPVASGGSGATILIALPYAVNVRDILRTSVFSLLKQSGARLVILSPAHDQPEFVAEFAAPNVFFEPLHPHKPGPLERKLDTLRYTLFSELTETFGIRSVPPKQRPPLKRAVLATAQVVSRTLGHRRTEAALAQLNLALFPDRQYASVLHKYRPDLVCLTRVFGWGADLPVLKAALQERIPTMLLVSSWDNLTSKGVFPARVDRLVVWNSTLADEAIRLHGYDPAHVLVAGVPQFDIYADKTQLPDREAFFRRVGGDPSKRLVTFALSNETWCPDEFDVAEMVWKAMREGALGQPCQLLCRVHPLAFRFGQEFPERLRGLPDLLVDIPGRPGVHLDRDTPLDDMKHLAATMWHSDVVINTSSTISIDAAALDTPVVCACWDGYRTLPDDKSVRRYHKYTHFKKLLSLGGVRVAHSLDEMVGHLRSYLADPVTDREGRARIVEEQCRSMDGKAGERMAEYILRTVQDKRARAGT